jgi:lipoprotein signal peptidase
MDQTLPTRRRNPIARIVRHDALRMAALLAVAAFLLDWTSKSWALEHLDGAIRPLGSLTLGVVRNSGFAFSIGAESLSTGVVMGVRLALLAGLLLISRRLNGMLTRRNACGVGLLVAGGFGNSADLIFRDGAVVDFIGAGPVIFDPAAAAILPAIVFNAADLWILFGIGLLAPAIHGIGSRSHKRLARTAFGRVVRLRAEGPCSSD